MNKKRERGGRKGGRSKGLKKLSSLKSMQKKLDTKGRFFFTCQITLFFHREDDEDNDNNDERVFSLLF